LARNISLARVSDGSLAVVTCAYMGTSVLQNIIQKPIIVNE